MRDASTTPEPTDEPRQERDSRRPARPEPRFPRRLRGYDRTAVDAWAGELEASRAELELLVMELQAELLETTEHSTEVSNDLRRARTELRYWNDRSSYIESEVARARQTAAEIEQAARERAEKVELEAQERALQLVDRVCEESNALLTHAREEARDMFLQFETEVDMSQQKLDRLEAMRRDVATTMQEALSTFEDAVIELDKVSPTKRLVQREEPVERRSGRTLGQDVAAAAARRFLEQRDATATSVPVSTPLPKVLSASVFDADERTKAAADPSEPAPVVTIESAIAAISTYAMPTTLAHGAVAMSDDETFAALTTQPLL